MKIPKILQSLTSTDAGIGSVEADDALGLDNARRRRRQRFRLAAAAAATFAALAAAVATTEDKRPRANVPYETASTDLTLAPERIERRNYVLQLEGAIRETNDQLKVLSGRLDEQEKQLRTLRDEAARRAEGPQNPLLEADTESAPTQEVPVAQPPSAAGGFDADPVYERPMPQLMLVEVPNAQPESRTGIGSRRHAESPMHAEFAPFRRALLPEAPLAVNRSGGESAESYLPASSFVSVRLLTGGYVGTGAGANLTPIPVVMRLEEPVTLPNQRSSNLEGCLLTGHATGDISAERIHIRLDRLACVSPNGETLDMRVQGYVVDDAGMEGTPGRLVTRSGQAVANALAVSLLSGIGEAVSLSSQNISTSSITGTQTRDVKNAWRAGIGEGIQDGMDRIVDYYLKIADQVLPVLEVTPGVRLDAVFAQGAMIGSASPSGRTAQSSTDSAGASPATSGSR